MATQPPGWIDIHAHLDRLPDDELGNTISQAFAAGVETIVSTATDLVSARRVLDQCFAFPPVYGTAGISPFDVQNLPDNWETSLRAILKNERIIAVGEIGLDRSNPKYPSIDEQLPVFQKQLNISIETNKPAIVHSRGAERQVAEICCAKGCAKVLFHCFTGSIDALDFIVANGFFVSISGIATFNSTVLDLARRVPLDRIFIETDSPYLAPAPHRGKANQPAWVVHTGEMVAQCKGISTDRLKSAIADNFNRLFFQGRL